MILLDTHVLIWWVEDAERLPKELAAVIDERSPAMVSPVSFWN